MTDQFSQEPEFLTRVEFMVYLRRLGALEFDAADGTLPGVRRAYRQGRASALFALASAIEKGQIPPDDADGLHPRHMLPDHDDVPDDVEAPTS